MEPSRTFPIYQLQDAFEAFCNGEPLVKAQHRSLYYFLLGYCRRRGNTPRFTLAYEAGMHGSAIGSWATYDAALRALAEWGFIHYTPGANRYKAPIVELTFRNPTDDVLLTYWQSYCLSSANPTDDVLLTQVTTLKEELKKVSEELAKLKSGEGEAESPPPPPLTVSSSSQLPATTPPPAPPSSAPPPRSTATMPADEAPVFQRPAFRAFVTAMGYGDIDLGYYWTRILRKVEDAAGRTNKGWEDYILSWLDKDKNDPGGDKLVRAAAAEKGKVNPVVKRPRER